MKNLIAVVTIGILMCTTVSSVSIPKATCSNVWSRIDNARPSTLGVSQGALSSAACRANCLANSNCVGVTIQKSASCASTSPCYLDMMGASGSQLQTDKTYEHYDLTRAYPSDCTGGCRATWFGKTAVINSNSVKGYFRMINPPDCGWVVQNDPGFIVVTYVDGNCTIYSSTYSGSDGVAVAQGTSISGFTYAVNAECDPCDAIVHSVPENSLSVATQQQGVRGFQACKNLCYNMDNSQCISFQLDPSNGDCYTTPNVQGLVISKTTWGYFAITRSTCGSGCQDEFKVYQNTVSNSQSYGTTPSEQACRAACQADASCVGGDYCAATKSCSLNKGTLAGVVMDSDPNGPNKPTGCNHFELTRSASCCSNVSRFLY